jgi:hypothetical protein
MKVRLFKKPLTTTFEKPPNSRRGFSKAGKAI